MLTGHPFHEMGIEETSKYQLGLKKNKKTEKFKYLSGGLAMGVMKETRGVGLLVVELVAAFWGFEIGLEGR